MDLNMNWETNRIDLGVIKQNSVVRFKFNSLYPLDVVKFKPGCGGCTTLGKYENDTLPVVYKPGAIPKHIIRRPEFKFQVVTKTIVVMYEDGKQEILYFTAKIIK